jgi:digeranylgeranylglycerophospholipid reductase
LEGDFSHLGPNILVGLSANYLGYYWIFPTGCPGNWQSANVGVGFFPKTGKRRPNLLEELNLVIEKEKLNNYKIIKKCGGLIPVSILEQLVWDNIILIGDAAGLASSLHGGGIDTAVYSGRLAAQCISENNLNQYQEQIIQGVGARLAAEKDVSELWGKIGCEGMEFILGLICKSKENAILSKLINYGGYIREHHKGLTFFLTKFLPRSLMPDFLNIQKTTDA